MNNFNDTEESLISLQEHLFHVKGEAEALKEVLQELHREFFDFRTELLSLKSVISDLKKKLKNS